MYYRRLLHKTERVSVDIPMGEYRDGDDNAQHMDEDDGENLSCDVNASRRRGSLEYRERERSIRTRSFSFSLSLSSFSFSSVKIVLYFSPSFLFSFSSLYSCILTHVYRTSSCFPPSLCVFAPFFTELQFV